MIDRLRPLIGIQTLLMLTLVGLAGLAAEAFAPAGVDIRLWPIAVTAGVLGVALGLLRTPDSIAHLTAIGLGVGLAIVLVALRIPNNAAEGSYIDRVTGVTVAIRDWYVGVGESSDTEAILIVVLLQVITWLVAYLASWSLMRHGWVTVALALPAVMVAVVRVTMADYPPYLLEITLVVSIMLLARTTFLRRMGSKPPTRGLGSLVTATVVALLVLSIGVSTPEDLSSSTVEPAARYAAETWMDVQDRAGDWLADQFGVSGSRPPDIDDYPRYTAFEDAFSIGGELELTDEPEVLVRTGASAPYLTAQSYDRYTGRGWESTVEEGFQADGPDGVRYSPELTFRAAQSVPYSGAVNGERSPAEMEVTPLTPSSDRVFSAGMFLNSSEPASVRMSWRQLDNQVFPLRELDLATLPPDLTGVVSLLLRADALSVDGDGGLLYPADDASRERLVSVREQLGRRFVDVSWTVGDDGRADTLVVTGQLPVYDDNVSAKRAGGGVDVNDPYLVTSLRTTVDAEQLRNASTDYPSWVGGRYLEVPDTVTSRTVDLSAQVTAGVDNPYDRAKAIEEFLRNHIAYDLQVGIPSSEWDIVDYVLFEDQRGYCEHYASAMTVMLRSLGIPAKTVVGYYPGSWDEEAGGYLYQQQNAHAWTEAFFPGYGWIRFEPTAAQPESTLGADAEPEVPGELPTPTPEPAPVSVDQPSSATPEGADDGESGAIAEAVPQTPTGGNAPSWLAVVGLAATGIALGAGALWWLLTRSPALEPRALFGALVRWGRFGGVPGDPSSTPREYARHVGHRYPQFARGAFDVVDVYEDQRYGNRPPEQSRLERAAHAVRELQRSMIRHIVRRRR